MRSDPSRREFLISSSLAGLAVSASALSRDAASQVPPVPIIDTHQHLWDFRKFRPPWLSGKGEEKINRSYTPADYKRETAGLNVVKTVYMEVDVAPRQHVAEAEYVAEMCRSRSTPMVAAVVGCRPGLPGFEAYVRRFAGSKAIKGVRQVLQVPDTPPGYCLKPAFVKDIRLLGELGLTYDICIRPGELMDGAKLIDLCPHTRFVLDHCGNASARDPNSEKWRQDITAIARRKNVVCKVSGIIKTVKPEWDTETELQSIITHVIEEFGIGRVMFGGDWPVCNKTKSFRDWVTALRGCLTAYSEAEQRKLFHDNAARFYGIG